MYSWLLLCCDCVFIFAMFSCLAESGIHSAQGKGVAIQTHIIKIHPNAMSIRSQSRTNPMSIQSRSGGNQVPNHPILTRISCQCDANPVSIHGNQAPIWCQSGADPAPIHRQFDAYPTSTKHRSDANQVPIHSNLMPILSQSSSNPVPVHPNLTPIRCVPIQYQSSTSAGPIQRQSSTTPVPIQCQSSVNQFQSDTNPCQSNANHMSIKLQ